MMTLTTLTLMLACGGTTQNVHTENEDQGDLVEDSVGPLIDHDPISESQPGGVDVQVTADVWDEEGNVISVTLYFSQATSTDWQEVNMQVDPSTGLFRGTIPGTHVGSAEMRYYFHAVDNAFNVTIEPEDADVDRLEAYTFGVSTN
jgi:YD repeat-containing protein